MGTKLMELMTPADTMASESTEPEATRKLEARHLDLRNFVQGAG